MGRRNGNGVIRASVPQAVQLDELDLRLLEELSRDGRATYQALARRLGVSQGTARNRVSRLVRENIVQFAGIVNYNLFPGHFRAMVGLDVDAAHLKEVAEKLIHLPEVLYLAYATGSFDLLLIASFPSRAECLNFLSEGLAKLQGIKDAQTFMLLRVMKNYGVILDSPEFEL